MQPTGLDDRPAGIAIAALSALLCAIAMSWPILITGEVFVFFDTEGYLATGEKIFAILGNISGGNLSLSEPSAGLEGSEDAGFLRSFGYSFFAAGMTALSGPLGLALAQGWIASFMMLALIPRQVLIPAGLVLVMPLALTTLPWFTVFAMPDIFAAVTIIFGAALWRNFDTLTPWHKMLLVFLAACASLAHYGNPPLAFGLYSLVLGGRLIQRRLTPSVVLAAFLPILLGPVANLGASAAVLDTPSTAPKHLPILLARSIEDGPAAWYLAQACAARENLAICKAFDGNVPDDMTKFLWSDQGIQSLKAAEIEAIRREEAQVLLAAFVRYPAAQTKSLVRNAWLQFYSVGLAKIQTAPTLHAASVQEDTQGSRLVTIFDQIVDWTTLIGALALLPLGFANRTWIAPIGIVVVGLALNAIIFGGLSAPDDRYQARVVWILPALALGFGFAHFKRLRDEQGSG